MRIYGETFQQVGVLLGVMLILSIDRPVPDVAQAAILAATFLGGAFWAIILTLVIWRIQPYLPARRAVAAAYRALSAVAENLRSLVQSGDTGETAWDAHAQTHLGAARAAIETAREAVTDTLRARGGASEQARHGLIRLEAADQLLGALIAFGDTLQRAGTRQHEAAQRLLDMLRATLLEFALSIAADDVSTDQQLGRSIAAIASEAASLPEADPQRSIVEQIVERLQIAYVLSVPANFLPGAGLDGTPPDLRQRLLQPLRTNLDWRSPAFRHALRLTVAAAPALAFTMLWYSPIRSLVDDNHRHDDAAVFRPDLLARTPTHRRNSGGWTGRRPRRCRLHNADPLAAAMFPLAMVTRPPARSATGCSSPC